MLTHLALGQQMELVPGFLSLTHIQNRGVILGPCRAILFIASALQWLSFSYKIYRQVSLLGSI